MYDTWLKKQDHVTKIVIDPWADRSRCLTLALDSPIPHRHAVFRKRAWAFV